MNWKVRFKQKWFWLSIIPAALLLVQAVAVPFGYDFEIEPLNSQLIGIINALFVVLTILGIVVDPVTEGLSDSDLAKTYVAPRKKAEPLTLVADKQDQENNLQP